MNWSFPTTIWFGAGRVSELGAACTIAGIERPLLVTDRALAKLPITQQAMEICHGHGLKPELFCEVDSNPLGANVVAGIDVYRACNADGVIALGGGSGLDVGKLIAFAQGQTRPLWDFEDVADWWQRANATTIAPVVAIPTTAGTGSEVGRAGVVTEPRSQTKKIIFHPLMLPKVVIADPALTIGLPPALTAGTGMDALAHNLEAFCTDTYHPMCDGIATEGMRLVLDNLERAYVNGEDLDARGQLMSAAAMGAVAFQKGLGAIHSLSHPIGSLFDTHHGTTNALFMPYVLNFNRPAIEKKIARLASALEIPDGFDGFIARICTLRDTLQMPHTLAEVGVDATARERVVEMAVEDPTAATNPRLLDKVAARQIFDDALHGRL